MGQTDPPRQTPHPMPDADRPAGASAASRRRSGDDATPTAADAPPPARRDALAGLTIAAMESRRAEEMARMIARFGGTPAVSPSMREVPVERPEAAIEFAHRLLVGEVAVVVLMTGVGLRHLVAAVEKHVDRQRFLDSLSDVVTIVRGPKPVAVMKDLGLKPTHRVPEPNTWRELLETVDRHVAVAGQVVAVQEYGKPNPSLVAGLEAPRGGGVPGDGVSVGLSRRSGAAGGEPRGDHRRAAARGAVHQRPSGDQPPPGGGGGGRGGPASAGPGPDGSLFDRADDFGDARRAGHRRRCRTRPSQDGPPRRRRRRPRAGDRRLEGRSRGPGRFSR